MHDLDAAKDDAGTAEGLESEHRSSDVLDRPVVLLNDVVEKLALPNRYRRVMLGVIVFDARCIGAALVDRDGLWKAVALNGPSEKPFRRSPIALGRKQEVDGSLLSNRSENAIKRAREFSGYIDANRAFIPNYGDRWRNGEAISTAFVESAVNQIVSRRFVKKQQMRWTERGSHHLLQIRTRVLI